MISTCRRTFALAILVIAVCTHHALPAAAAAVAAAAPPAAAEQAYSLNTAVTGDTGRMPLTQGVKIAAFVQRAAVATAFGKPDAAPAFDFADIEVSTSLPPPTPTPEAPSPSAAEATAVVAAAAATATATAAKPAAATASTSEPTVASPGSEDQEGLPTDVETGTEADQSDTLDVGKVVGPGAEQQLSILASVTAKRASNAATKAASGMKARGPAAQVQGNNRNKKAQSARHSQPDSSSDSSSNYEEGATASHETGLEEPAQVGNDQEEGETHQKGPNPRRHGPKAPQRNKAKTGPSAHNLHQQQQQQQQHRHQQHQEPHQQQHSEQAGAEQEGQEGQELSKPSVQDEPSADAPKSPSRQPQKAKPNSNTSHGNSKSRSTGSAAQKQNTKAALASKQQLHTPAGRKYKHAKTTHDASDTDSQTEVPAAGDASGTGNAAEATKDTASGPETSSQEDSNGSNAQGTVRSTNPQEAPEPAAEQPTPKQRKHKATAHAQGARKGATKQAGQHVTPRLTSAEGSAEGTEPKAKAKQVASQGRLQDSAAELQIVYTGDGQDSGPEDLDGGLMWTVSADSGRSSSLNMLQPDGPYGSWAIIVTQVFKWATAPGVRPFLTFEGPVDKPTSVTIKGKLGGVVPGSQHQTQLTSSSTVTSAGRVPRGFGKAARVQIPQPKQCTYKWHSPDALDQKVECLGQLVSAVPTLEFDATFAEFLSAGLHQDLPFMEQLEVTCKITSCSSA